MNNKTDDGFAIQDFYQLRFTLLCWEWVKTSRGAGISLEQNESEGKRRPYVVIWVGRLTLQSGWLFTY